MEWQLIAASFEQAFPPVLLLEKMAYLCGWDIDEPGMKLSNLDQNSALALASDISKPVSSSVKQE